jgi:hypothetical protein
MLAGAALQPLDSDLITLVEPRAAQTLVKRAAAVYQLFLLFVAQRCYRVQLDCLACRLATCRERHYDQ